MRRTKYRGSRSKRSPGEADANRDRFTPMFPSQQFDEAFFNHTDRFNRTALLEEGIGRRVRLREPDSPQASPRLGRPERSNRWKSRVGGFHAALSPLWIRAHLLAYARAVSRHRQALYEVLALLVCGSREDSPAKTGRRTPEDCVRPTQASTSSTDLAPLAMDNLTQESCRPYVNAQVSGCGPTFAVHERLRIRWI